MAKRKPQRSAREGSAGEMRPKKPREGPPRLDLYGPSGGGPTKAEPGAAAKADEMARFRKRVLSLVARIPAGKVATYGQIAALAGHPRRARHVGQALAGPHEPVLPWHRVLNAQGKVSPRGGEATRKGPPPERRQQRLLEAEGVTFKGGRLDLERYRWRPEEAGGGLWAGIGPARKSTRTTRNSQEPEPDREP